MLTAHENSANLIKDVILISDPGTQEELASEYIRSANIGYTLLQLVLGDKAVENQSQYRIQGVAQTHNVIKKFFESLNLNLFIIGDGRKELGHDIDELKSLSSILTESHYNSTLIIINAHGTIVENMHCVSLNHEFVTPIIEIFKNINQHFKKPVDIFISSCHGGISSNYVDLLPKGSRIATFRSDDKEIDGSYMIHTIEFLKNQHLSSISTTDIIEGFLQNVDWQSKKAFPSLSISGQHKELSFEHYYNKVLENLQYSLIELKNNFISHILEDLLYDNKDYDNIRNNGTIDDKFQTSLNSLHTLPEDHFAKNSTKHIIEEISIVEQKISEFSKNASNLFENYQNSNNCPVSITDLKSNLVSFLHNHNQNQEVIDSYLACLDHIDESDFSLLTGDTIPN